MAGFTHENWTSRTAFLMAAVGAAVGLGNVWRFPYVTGTSGGGAFVLVYLGAVLLIAIPILIAETMIGRHGHMSAPVSMRQAARSSGASDVWGFVGWLGVATAFLILSFYSVIGGWVFAYVAEAVTGTFAGIDRTGAETVFGGINANPMVAVFWHTVFIAVTISVVAKGVNSGIEKSVGVLMPGLFIMLLVMVGYAIAAGDAAAGLGFLFTPDFSKIDDAAVLAAIGQAFFSIGVGMAIMFTYGAYLPSGISLTGACVTIALADTLVAVLAGIAIFPIVFGNGLEPGAGPGLVFLTLPVAFGQMAGGGLFGAVFFILLAFAALTSAIALLDTSVAWAEEHRGWSRVKCALIAGGLVWAIGIGSAVNGGILDLADQITGQFMLPVGGLLIAIFAGWVLKPSIAREELDMSPLVFKAWRFLLKFVCPIAIAAIIASNLIDLDGGTPPAPEEPAVELTKAD